MTRYRAVYEGSHATIAGPSLKYRPVLDEARAYAFQAATNVVILEDERPILIVKPNGATERPSPGYRANY